MFVELKSKYYKYLTKTNDVYLNEYNEPFSIDNSSPKELKDLVNKHYVLVKKSNDPLYNFIYNNGINPIKTKEFNYIIVSNLHSQRNTILEFLSDMLGNISSTNIKGYEIIIYEDTGMVDMESIIEAINDDFALNLKVFVGCLIDDVKKFNSLLVGFFMFNNTTSIKELVIEISKNDHNILSIYKELVIKDLFEDEQLELIVDRMFKNNLHITNTANDVYMHRNTINNKLAFIKRRTSLDISNFLDALAMFFLVNS